MQYNQHIESESFMTQDYSRPGGLQLTLRRERLNEDGPDRKGDPDTAPSHRTSLFLTKSDARGDKNWCSRGDNWTK